MNLSFSAVYQPDCSSYPPCCLLNGAGGGTNLTIQRREEGKKRENQSPQRVLSLGTDLDENTQKHTPSQLPTYLQLMYGKALWLFRANNHSHNSNSHCFYIKYPE